MLPKSERLTKEDFTASRLKVFFRGELLDVAFIALPTQKFACVIAKKTLKRAVDRNKVKRRIMNALNTIEVSSPDSFVIYPKKRSSEVPYSQLYKEIETAFATLQ